MYALKNCSSIKDPRLKSLRLIELSDHIVRLNRHENTQLELRLNQLERRERIIQQNYDRDIYFRRLQLAQIYKALNEPTDSISKTNRMQIPMSFYAIKMRRNKSAPPNIQREEAQNKTQTRPNTTSNAIRCNKRAMSTFKEITLKPTYQTLGNMLLLLDNEKKYFQTEWPIRSRTMQEIESIVYERWLRKLMADLRRTR